MWERGLKWRRGSLERKLYGRRLLAAHRRQFNAFADRKPTHLHVWGVLTGKQLSRILSKHPGAHRMKGHAMRGEETVLKMADIQVLPLPDLYVLADRLLLQLDQIDEWLGAAQNGMTKREYKLARTAKITQKGKVSTQYRAVKRAIATRHRSEFTIGSAPPPPSTPRREH